MFFTWQKYVYEIHDKGKSAKESVIELINTLTNEFFLLAVEDYGYALTRYLAPELAVCNNDAKQAMSNFGEFVAQAIWDNILTAA